MYENTLKTGDPSGWEKEGGFLTTRVEWKIEKTVNRETEREREKEIFIVIYLSSSNRF